MKTKQSKFGEMVNRYWVNGVCVFLVLAAIILGLDTFGNPFANTRVELVESTETDKAGYHSGIDQPNGDVVHGTMNRDWFPSSTTEEMRTTDGNGAGIGYFDINMSSGFDSGMNQSVTYGISTNENVAVRADQLLGEGAYFKESASFYYPSHIESYVAILAVDSDGRQVVVILDEFGALFDKAVIGDEYGVVSKIDNLYVQNMDVWSFNFIADGNFIFRRLSGITTEIVPQ